MNEELVERHEELMERLEELTEYCEDLVKRYEVLGKSSPPNNDIYIQKASLKECIWKYNSYH